MFLYILESPEPEFKRSMTFTLRRLLPTAAVLILLIAGCGNADTDDAGTESAGVADTAETVHGHEDSGTTGGDHDHSTVREVADRMAVPTIAIEIAADPVEGWNLRVSTTGFRVVPENVSTTHVDGEGHMHIYVDGEKVSRLYGEWHHIGGLEAGNHDVRVELSSNDHSAMAVDGRIIDARAEIFQDRRTDLDAVRTEPVEAVEPHPSLSIEIVDDPAGGWSLHAVPSNFRLAPENASTPHVDGEGHMRLYIDGEPVARVYETWHQMPPLEAGTHEIRVDLGSNDHAPITVNGLPVEATTTLEVAADDPTPAGGHEHDHQHDHGDAGADTQYDADVAGADQTITVDVVDGGPDGGVRRVAVDRGSVVALQVTSDTAEEVHVHGYDILRAVSDGHPAHFAFTAEIPGVFEVELEGSGRLLLQLEIS